MKNALLWTLAGSALVAGAACSDLTSSSSSRFTTSLLTAAFETQPYGFPSTQNSFDASGAPDAPWMPPAPGMDRGGPGGPGMMGPGGDHHDHDGPFEGGGLGPFGGLMGGGLGIDFMGGHGLGHEMGHGRLGDPHFAPVCNNATYSATTGRVTCDPVTHNGLTENRSLAYTDASGKAQSAFDSTTTNAINTQVAVSGTVTRRDSSTTQITSASNRTVSGLAKGSTAHTIDGTAVGHESTAGKNRDGNAFTAVRDVADTVKGLLVPVDTGRVYPRAGTVIRVMNATVTVAGSAAQTSKRREVLTYDGSATAKLVITQNDTTKTCSLPLTGGRPSCQ